MPGLLSAVYNKHAFVLCVLDNSLTAMTGGQSHPGLGGKPRREDTGIALSIEAAARGCGVTFIETVGAYDVDGSAEAVKRAWEYAKNNKTPTVVIHRHPCMLLRAPQENIPVTVEKDNCVGCRYCIEHFACPGLVFDVEAKKAFIDARYCVSCGVCVNACPQKAIIRREEVR